MLFSLGCKEKLLIISDPNYAIGYIDDYSPRYNAIKGHINFHFFVENKLVSNGYSNLDNGWTVPDDAKLVTGDMFMLQYSQHESRTARIIFCYPIKDSTEFNNYLTQFLTTAPSCY